MAVICCIDFYFVGIVYITFRLKTIISSQEYIVVKHNKNGFFLIELMIGLSISTFFILIITHYIIEVKVTQQKALKCAEEVSMIRNQRERDCVKTYGMVHA